MTTNPSPPDWRGLCEELLGSLENEGHAHWPGGPDGDPLIERARAALSQPEPEVVGPTDEEVEVWADQQGFVRGHADHPCGFWIDDGDVGALVRAALARWGGAGLAPVEGEVAELALKELERTMVLLMPVTGKNKIKRFDTIRAALKRLHELENKADLSPAPPTPKPADGEVGELVAKLRRLAPHNPLGTADPTITRAADLLEQRHPAPVPVAERLPGPEDCDAEGFCWWFSPADPSAGTFGVAAYWVLRKHEPEDDFRTHWLLATALPLPSGEVQS